MTLLLCFGIGHSASAKEKWIDVTKEYISNPSFTVGNYDEWEVSGTARSIVARAGCMEMWSGKIDVQKTITGVPNGRYRFRVQAFYRTKSHHKAYREHRNGTENIRGFFFANELEKPLASQYDYYLKEDPNCGNYHIDGVYYPNSMEAAEIAFNEGGFWNELEFDVSDGEIIIGLYNDESIDDNWLVFDNVTIERLTDVNEPTAGSLVINEIMAANADMFMSPAFNFDGWVELYNPTNQDVWLGGCYLSDDPLNLTKWQMPDDSGSVPAKGFKTLWLGSNEIKTNQSPFKLECEGGSILISDPYGNLLAKQAYPMAKTRLSWARTTDGGSSWKWTGNPTPAATNATSAFASSQLKAPEALPEGKLFTRSVNVYVTIPEGATLRYTTDGSTPTMTNGMTSHNGVFTTRETVSYRFRLFQEGQLPSPVTTRTFIKSDKTFELPVIMVSTKDEYLYDDMIGVYVKGKNGRTGNGQSTPANWNMDWDRPVNFQYIAPGSKSAVVNQDVDFSISGGWTRANSVKSFKLKADRVYEGLNAFDYPFFDAKPYNKNKTLQVRGGGNDNWCKIKDAALQTIMQRAGINLDLVSYQPAVHFINGEYKGLINIREPNNKDFAYANFGYSKSALDVYEQSPDSGAYMMVGTKDALVRLLELSETACDRTSYDEIKTLLDIDEYANYMAALLYLGSWDWPDNNVKAYRCRENGKYRFVVFDLDSAFGTDDRDTDENGSPIYRNTFRWLDGMQWHWYDYIYDEGRRRYGEIKFCTFFFNMLENDEFRRKFINTFCIMGGSVFDPETAETILDELGNRVRPTMAMEGTNPDGSLNEIRTKLKGRMNEMTGDMIAYERLRLTDIEPQHVMLSADNKNARLFIDDIEVPRSRFDGSLFAPVTFKAVAPAGYKLTGWKKYHVIDDVLFDKGSDWTYYDKGSLHDTDWKSAGHNTTAWQNGPAPLGYGKDYIATTMDYGNDANHKRPTYYLRKTVTLKDNTHESFVLNFTADDGFVVYVNGKEGGRYNLNTGVINYDTYAKTADSNPDNGTMKLDASLFKTGENIIAVELHNNNANSTDIVWDAQLICSAKADDNSGYYSTAATIDLPADNDIALMACFTPLSDGEKRQKGVTPVMINEISCSNSIYVSDYFKRDDWLELYNTTDEDIDIEGMYLSNDPANPLLYQITKGTTTASTVIPAHGYKIIWCDKQANMTQLHAPFKISSLGGEIVLTAKDRTWKNSIRYTTHNGDETVGRYPDGNDKVYTMNIPTIEKANIYTSYLAEIQQGTTDGIGQTYDDGLEGMTMRYAAGRIIVNTANAEYARVAIYSISGQEMSVQEIAVADGTGTMDVSSLPAGCYIAKATDNNGRKAACKFVVTRR